jgi:hypothetical protein
MVRTFAVVAAGRVASPRRLVLRWLRKRFAFKEFHHLLERGLFEEAVTETHSVALTGQISFLF